MTRMFNYKLLWYMRIRKCGWDTANNKSILTINRQTKRRYKRSPVTSAESIIYFLAEGEGCLYPHFPTPWLF